MPPDMAGNEEGTVAEVTGKIMVVAIIILFLVVIFVLFLHLYAKWFWWQHHDAAENQHLSADPHSDSIRRGRRHRFVFTPGPGQMQEKRGLDAATLRSLEVLVWKSDIDGLLLECTVCLCELVEGDNARMLPKCNHAFHLECIDMWFQSHSTCPLCRNSVKPQIAALEVENQNGVANVPDDVMVNAAESSRNRRVLSSISSSMPDSEQGINHSH